MQPFFQRLLDYWDRVGTVLRGESAAASIFPNSSDVGSARERLYVDFLLAHIPAFCTVKLGGFAFGSDGSESKQVDVLVASGGAVQFDFHNRDRSGKSFASVEGLIAAVSLKSYLDGRELLDSVQNLASIPVVSPLGKRKHPLLPDILEYDSWPFKVIYAPDGISLDSAMVHLQQAVADVPPVRWPDLVHVCGKYVIVKTGAKGGTTRDGTIVAPHSFHPMTIRPDTIAFSMVVERIQSMEQSMRFMLFNHSLLDRLPL